MKKVYFILVLILPVVLAYAQQEFHVFPENHNLSPGSSTGNGSLQSPWDLQTALKLPNNVINGGDTKPYAEQFRQSKKPRLLIQKMRLWVCVNPEP